MQRAMKPIPDRFWEKVNKETKSGCWEWTSSIRGNGYGAFFTNLIEEGRKCHGAHRFSWTLVNGEIPNGLWVLHKCDNRICVNPDHLFLGDRKDNMMDCAEKGRINTTGKSRLTHCIHGHEFTSENTRVNKLGHRRCKECDKVLRKSYLDANKDRVNENRRSKYSAIRARNHFVEANKKVDCTGCDCADNEPCRKTDWSAA